MSVNEYCNLNFFGNVFVVKHKQLSRQSPMSRNTNHPLFVTNSLLLLSNILQDKIILQ